MGGWTEASALGYEIGRVNWYFIFMTVANMEIWPFQLADEPAVIDLWRRYVGSLFCDLRLSVAATTKRRKASMTNIRDGIRALFLWVIFAAGAIALADTARPASASAEQNAGPTTNPAAVASSQPAVVTVTVRAYIDGRSRLSLKGNSASWENLEFAAPGKMGGHNDPTTINGVRWVPTWEDSDVSPEVRLEKSKSDVFNGVEPALAAVPMVVTLEKIRCRENASVVQQPTAENDFTTIVEFDDSRTGGADWYEVKLTFGAGK